MGETKELLCGMVESHAWGINRALCLVMMISIKLFEVERHMTLTALLSLQKCHPSSEEAIGGSQLAPWHPDLKWWVCFTLASRKFGNIRFGTDSGERQQLKHPTRPYRHLLKAAMAAGRETQQALGQLDSDSPWSIKSMKYKARVLVNKQKGIFWMHVYD